MRPQYTKRAVRISFARELRLLVCSMSLLFLLIALISYHPYDSSWFYASTDPVVILNKGGVVGAATAALFFYFLGAASFALLGMLFFMLYLSFTQRSWRSEWERVGAGFTMVFVMAALCAKYGIDFWGSGYAGGLIGRGVKALLNSFFDTLMATLFLYMLFFVCFFLVFRVSWIAAVRAVVWGVRLLAHSVRGAERVWAPAYKVGKKIVSGACQPLVLAARLAKKACEGSLITDADYTVIDYETELDALDDFFPEHGGTLDGDAQKESMDESAACSSRGAASSRSERVSDEAKQLRLDMPSANECLAGASSLHQTSRSSLTQAGKSVQDVAQAASQMPISESVQAASVPQAHKPYQLPSMSLFIGFAKERQDKQVRQELEERAHLLEEKLQRFGVLGRVTAIKYGPVVTLFEYQPGIDTKLSKILALEDDLALALQAVSIRILAPIPGRAVVGFEVANQRRLDVVLSTLIRSKQYQAHTGVLPLILGEDTIGEFVVVDLSKMPHLLIAGSTGSGKSVALNVMLISLLCRLSPDDLKLVLIDPKRLEFASYADIAHLIFPVITEATQATIALRWVVQEMEERYQKMASCGVRTIADYRAKQVADPLPYIVVIIDELADLMMTAGKDCQDLITRITQMARAAGIHLVVATQRPSVDVITGLIKANFPCRISFRVASKIDSRTILDCGGADKLLGRGDMLLLDAGSSAPRRVHGAYVSDKEIEGVIAHIRAERPVVYRDLMAEVGTDDTELLSAGDDALYRDVRSFLASVDEVSISLLQRKFRIGYNRSARIIDMLETQGLVLPADGGKTRKVIH